MKIKKEDIKYLIIGIVIGFIVMNIIDYGSWIYEAYFHTVPYYETQEEYDRAMNRGNEITNNIFIDDGNSWAENTAINEVEYNVSKEEIIDENN